MIHEVSLRSGLIASSSDEQQVDKRTREMRADYGFAGASREAWLLHSAVCANGTHGCPSTTILKTLRWRELHDQIIHDMQRIDAVVSERLTASPHVIDIYGYCGASALNEYADGGMFAKTFRHHYSDKKTYTDDELLVFARDAALSLADIHDLDGRGNVTSFVHHDLRAENFLMSNGVLKISDFNNGQLLRWDFGQKKRCNGFDWSGGCGATMENTNRKAPEECLEETNRTLTTEKVEVYRFGAFLFFLISKGNWPYSYEPSSNGTLHRPKPDKVKKMIVSGKKPSLPPFVKESNSTAIQAIVHAMEMAYTFDTKKRPSAREIAEYLVGAASNNESLVAS
jgi:serine/threonine protein kinase